MASLDLRCEMYLVQIDVKCKTSNFQFNSSKFIICVFLSESPSSYVINSIAADVLTQGARSSAAMVFAGFSWNIPVSAPEKLIVIFHFIFNAYGSVFLFIICHSRQLTSMAMDHKHNTMTVPKRSVD